MYEKEDKKTMNNFPNSILTFEKLEKCEIYINVFFLII